SLPPSSTAFTAPTTLNFLSGSATTTTQSKYVAIALNNGQTSPTPAPFEQKVVIGASTYSSIEASDLGNIRFQSTASPSGCSTGCAFSGPLNSWLESCASTPCNSATNTVFWVKLPNGIAASATLTIYMVFASTSVEFDGSIAGEAPNISTPYGLYDNGANVFTFYDNFAGTSLNAKWTRVASGAGGTVTVNNGATFAAAATTDWIFVYSGTQTQPRIAESYMVSVSGDDPMLGEETSGLTNGFHAMYKGYSLDWFAGAPGQEEEFCPQTSAGAGTCILQSASTFPAGIWSLRWAAAGNEGSTDGAGTSITSTDNSVGAIANYGIYLGTSEIGTGSNAVRWARMRAYPPAGVMPTGGGTTSVPLTTAATTNTPPALYLLDTAATSSSVSDCPSGSSPGAICAADSTDTISQQLNLKTSGFTVAGMVSGDQYEMDFTLCTTASSCTSFVNIATIFLASGSAAGTVALYYCGSSTAGANNCNTGSPPEWNAGDSLTCGSITSGTICSDANIGVTLTSSTASLDGTIDLSVAKAYLRASPFSATATVCDGTHQICDLVASTYNSGTGCPADTSKSGGFCLNTASKYFGVNEVPSNGVTGDVAWTPANGSIPEFPFGVFMLAILVSLTYIFVKRVRTKKVPAGLTTVGSHYSA
ncbi:MAG TPA: hypothetical protein VGR53_09960, partial [Nitrososphaerales archaeon]|nr:hypothetical protein [Nitrososphaerales archaeon]